MSEISRIGTFGAAVALVAGSVAAEPTRLSLFQGLPLAFEEVTRGGEPYFETHGSGFAGEVTRAGLRITLGQDGTREDVTLRLVGASGSSRPEPRRPLAARFHYLVGKDRSQFRTDVVPFGEVRLGGVQPGVDLLFKGTGSRLEYDLTVAPGANPEKIRLQFGGTKALRLAADGGLVVRTGSGRELVWDAPVLYQEDDAGRRSTVAGAYRLAGKHRVAFEVGPYDRSRPLVIDPVLSFVSFVLTTSEGTDLALGPDGSLFLSEQDGVVYKLDAKGQLVFKTRIGGLMTEELAVDGQGNVYVTGLSLGGLLVQNPYQASLHGTIDAALVKLSSDGESVLYATYLGGTGNERGNGLAVDAEGAAYVGGYTTSRDFPTTEGAFQRQHNGGTDAYSPGGYDVFVTKFSPDGRMLAYSTYLGGSGDDGYSLNPSSTVGLDGKGHAYVGGHTGSHDFPTTTGAVQVAYGGGQFDAFVAKLKADGSGLEYSTYVGGNDYDMAVGLAVDESGNAYITGATSSRSSFPLTPGAYSTQPGICCLGEGFLTKLDPTGSRLAYSTFLGPSSSGGLAVAVDGGGRAAVTGRTSSNTLPLVDPIQPTCASCPTGSDAFVMQFNSTGSGLNLSTYLGGTGNDSGHAIAARCNRIFIAGIGSPGFPAQGPQPQAPTALPTGQSQIVAGIQVAGTVELILDVNGYFEADGSLRTITPCRLVDTRSAEGPQGGPSLESGLDRAFPVVGVCGIPSTATAVSLNVTATGPQGSGFVTLFPEGESAPLSSSLNYSENSTRAGNGVFRLGTSGNLIARAAVLP